MTDVENTLRVYNYEAIQPIIGWPQWREDDTGRICQLRGRSVFAYDPPPTGQRPSEGWSVVALFAPRLALLVWRSWATEYLDKRGIYVWPFVDLGCFRVTDDARDMYLAVDGKWHGMCEPLRDKPPADPAGFPTRDAAGIAAALALHKSPDESGQSPACFDCGSACVVTLERQEFIYGVGAAGVTLAATVPVHRCTACGFTFTDRVAEEARSKAVCLHLKGQDHG